jgi:hypothetical protein
VVLELVSRPRAFGLATALVALGFGISLNFVNVDGWIAAVLIMKKGSWNPMQRGRKMLM